MNPSTTPTKRFGRKVMAGTVGLAALGASVLVAPTLASAQEATPDPEVTVPESTDATESNRGKGHRHGHAHRSEKAAALAEILGVTVEDLQDARQNGQSVADVAAANGVELSTVTDAIETALNERLDAKVAEGRITAEEADERRAQLAERIEEKVNEVPGEGNREGKRDGRRGHRHGPRGDRGGATTDAGGTAGAVFFGGQSA